MARNAFSFARPATRLAAGLGACAIAFAAVPAAADVKAGVDAWSQGDYATAVAEWEGPAQAGDADALFNLAQAYRLGRGVEADMERASALYEQAAARGHVKAADNYGLLLFQQGQQDKAMPLISAAADRGDPRAQYVLGLAHFNADFASKDWVRAYALLTLANGAGLPQAATALQQMDSYVPLSQRQQAQTLARSMEEQAAQRRSAELAALDLGASPAAAASAPVSAPAPAPVQPAVTRSAAADQRPVRVAGQVERQSQTPVQVQPAPAPAQRMVAAAPAPAPAPVAAPASAPVRASGNWQVQLGAFGVAGNADRLWTRLQSNPALAGTRKSLVPGGNVTRLLAVGFGSRAEAQAACDTLKRQGQGCIVKAP